VIIIENNSEEPETFEYYETLCHAKYEKEAEGISCEGKLSGGQRIKVVNMERRI